MATVLRCVDISDAPDLIRFVEESIVGGEPVVIRRAGRDIALLEPLSGSDDLRPRLTLTVEEEEAFRSSAGAWKGNVDGDKLIREIYEGRGRPVDEE